LADYELQVEGHLEERWASWFDGLRETHHGDGTTALNGPVVDEAAPHRGLTHLRDLGLPLRCIRQVPPSPAPPAPTTPELCPTPPGGERAHQPKGTNHDHHH